MTYLYSDLDDSTTRASTADDFLHLGEFRLLLVNKD